MNFLTNNSNLKYNIFGGGGDEGSGRGSVARVSDFILQRI